MRLAVLAFAVWVGMVAACGAGGSDPAGRLSRGDRALVVAAAADLRPAFEEIGAAFESESGQQVVFDFGSSGQLAQRIIEGAPADVFASASPFFIDRVLDSGRGDSGTKSTFAFGRITIWSRSDYPGRWSTLEELAADQRVRYLAIANPEHAPYGLAARQALESAGVWEKFEERIVLGENVSDTQRLADSGQADVAIIALSLSIAAGDRGTWVLIDEDLHYPLEQALVVVAEEPERLEAAAGFVGFLNQPQARRLMADYGFVLPGEGAGTG